jgi:DNA polymerase-3 subunit delta'
LNYPGNEERFADWTRGVRGGRLHHAFLLAGPEGLGKAAFARMAARHLVGAEGAGFHPNIITLERLPKDEKEARKQDEGAPFVKKRNITVAQIRGLQQRLTSRLEPGQRQAVIIDPADAMERPAANALLKSLEEPRTGTHFFLISHRPAALLATIRSRCQLIRFNPLTEPTIAEWLATARPDASPSEIASAARAGNGSPGRALAFLNQGLAPLQAAVHAAIGGEGVMPAPAELVKALGTRPDIPLLAAALRLARIELVARLDDADRPLVERLAIAYAECARLERELDQYNYEPGLIAERIANLLADVTRLKQPANG